MRGREGCLRAQTRLACLIPKVFFAYKLAGSPSCLSPPRSARSQWETGSWERKSTRGRKSGRNPRLQPHTGDTARRRPRGAQRPYLGVQSRGHEAQKFWVTSAPSAPPAPPARLPPRRRPAPAPPPLGATPCRECGRSAGR